MCDPSSDEEILPAGSMACRVGALHRCFTAAASRLLRPHGVTPAQAYVLYEVREGQQSPTGIANALGVELSSVSRLLGRMERDGLLRRDVDPDDRTRVVVSLTLEGRGLAERIDFHAEVIHDAVERALTPDEVARLNGWIERVARELDTVE